MTVCSAASADDTPVPACQAILAWVAHDETAQIAAIGNSAGESHPEREARKQVLEKLLPHQNVAALRRYGVMLVLSVAIASMGLAANSAAVVIGAMLIAPLMTPIMTFAAAMVLGLPRRMSQAATIVVASSVVAIALAGILAAVVPNAEIGSEVLSRTSPDVRDLLVAVAAGAAGAYAIARDEVSTSLPGVAVAVALVPPLAAVGVLLQAGRSDLAQGAALLFVTNLLAIIVVGAMVLVLTGVVPTLRLAARNPRVVTVMVATVLLLVMTGIVLIEASSAVARDTDKRLVVEATVEEWLSTSTLSVQNLEIDGSVVALELVGEEQPPAALDLVHALTLHLGPQAEVQLRWTERAEATARASGELDQELLVRPVLEDWIAGFGVGYELLDVVAGEVTVVAEVAGPTLPTGSDAVELELRARLGQPIDLVVRWTQRLDLAAGELPAQETGQAVVEAWIGARGSVSLLNVQVAQTLVTVDLVARDPLLGVADLRAALFATFPDRAITVRVAPLEPADSFIDDVDAASLE